MTGLQILNQAASRFNQFCKPGQALPLPLAPEIPLADQGSPLDSLGLMNFIMEVELVLEEAGSAINLTDGQALSFFGTAGELAAFIEGKLSGD
jgi:hypothetical protein